MKALPVILYKPGFSNISFPTMKKLFIAAISLVSALSALAWSQKGHDTVAYIAESHLTKAAADSVEYILDGMSPVYWANWLDNASHTPDYAYTKTWHYKTWTRACLMTRLRSTPREMS